VPQTQGLASGGGVGGGHATGGPVHVFQRVGDRRLRYREDDRRPDHDAADDGHQQRDATAHVAGSPVAHAPSAAATVAVTAAAAAAATATAAVATAAVRRFHAAQRLVRLHAARVVAQLARVRRATYTNGRRHRVLRAARVPKRFHHPSEYEGTTGIRCPRPRITPVKFRAFLTLPIRD